MLGRKKTYYEILNVSPDVTTADLKRAYKELLLSTHPDKDKVRKEQTKRSLASIDDIKEAYNTLIDPKLRSDYDAKLILIGKQNGVFKFGDGVDEVSLDTFGSVEDAETSDDVMHYVRSCPRCHTPDGFRLDDDLLEEYAVRCEDRDDDMYQVLIQCNSCSLWLKVNFYAVDDE